MFDTATKIAVIIMAFASGTAMAACYQGDIKPKQISARLKQPSVVISWSGQLKDQGQIAVGGETKSLQDFSCFPNDSYVADPTSHDSFLCSMGDAGSFRVQLNQRNVQSILLQGKFGFQAVDDSGDGALVVISSRVSNLIPVQSVPSSVCADVFPPTDGSN